jgi:hypothetical protein
VNGKPQSVIRLRRVIEDVHAQPIKVAWVAKGLDLGSTGRARRAGGAFHHRPRRGQQPSLKALMNAMTLSTVR